MRCTPAPRPRQVRIVAEFVKDVIHRDARGGRCAALRNAILQFNGCIAPFMSAYGHLAIQCANICPPAERMRHEDNRLGNG